VFHVYRSARRKSSEAYRAHRTQNPLGFGWCRPAILASLFGTAMTLATVVPPLSVSTATAQPQMVQPAQPGYAQPVQDMPLDGPLRIIAAARQRAQQVNDYQCLLISQERVKGVLLPENVMQMSFRKVPFSVYMKWLAPKDKAGQEVCYVYGRNNNQMKVHPVGIGAAFGWTSIDTKDPRVMEHSRHTITEAGILNLIERTAKCWEAERALNKTQVNIAEYEYNKQRCVRVETVHVEKMPTFYCYRNVIYFDKETWLPIRTESYDWPRQGGPPEGELLECFSYVDMHINVGITDQVFNH
jgi:hypothetical protein